MEIIFLDISLYHCRRRRHRRRCHRRRRTYIHILPALKLLIVI